MPDETVKGYRPLTVNPAIKARPKPPLPPLPGTEPIRAIKLISEWPEFLSYLRRVCPGWPQNLVVTPYSYHRLVVADDDTWFVTWCRSEMLPTGPLTVEDWQRTEGKLWVADFVHSTTLTTPKAAVRAGMRELIRRGIADRGEKMYLWRRHSRRTGWFHMR